MLEVPRGHPEKPQGKDGFKLLERMNEGTHEELALWGLSFLPINKTDRILDIGCGGGANLQRLLTRAPNGSVCGIDYSQTSVQMSRNHNKNSIASGCCKVLEGNVSHLPFNNHEFDIATAFETTYYWDLSTAFPEVRRVLKPDGLFLICNEDNGLDEERLALAAQIPGMKMFTTEQLISALEHAGFTLDASKTLSDKSFISIIARA